MGSPHHRRKWSLEGELIALAGRLDHSEDTHTDPELVAHLHRSPVLHYVASSKRPSNPMARSLDMPGHAQHTIADTSPYGCSPLSKRRRGQPESPSKELSLGSSSPARFDEWADSLKPEGSNAPKDVTASLNDDMVLQKRRCISPLVTLEKHERYRANLPLRLNFMNTRESGGAHRSRIAHRSPIRQLIPDTESRDRGSDGLSPLRELIRRQRLN